MPTEGLKQEALDETMERIGTADPITQLIDHYNTWQDSPYVNDTGRRGADSQLVLVSDEDAMTEVRVVIQRGLHAGGSLLCGMVLHGLQPA